MTAISSSSSMGPIHCFVEPTTPLQEALDCCHCYDSLKKFLLSVALHQMDSKSKEIFTDVLFRCRFGKRGIVAEAIERCDREVIDKLLFLGFRISSSYWNPSPIAILSTHIFIYLIERGDQLDPESEAYRHFTKMLIGVVEDDLNFGSFSSMIELFERKLTPKWLELYLKLGGPLNLSFCGSFHLFRSKACLFIPISATNTIIGKIIGVEIAPLREGPLVALPVIPTEEECRAILRTLIFHRPKPPSTENFYSAVAYLIGLFSKEPQEEWERVISFFMQEIQREPAFDATLYFIQHLKNCYYSTYLFGFEKFSTQWHAIAKQMESFAIRHQFHLWGAVAKFVVNHVDQGSAMVTFLLQIGVDPNLQDPETGQHLLFIPTLSPCELSIILRDFKVDRYLIDNHGCNALEHLINQILENTIPISRAVIENLQRFCKHELPIRIFHPDWERAIQLFGNGFESIMIYLLLRTRDQSRRTILFRDFFRYVNSKTFLWDLARDRDIFEEILLLYPTIPGIPNISINPILLELQTQIAFSDEPNVLLRHISHGDKVIPLIPYIVNTEEYKNKVKEGSTCLESINWVIEHSSFVRRFIDSTSQKPQPYSLEEVMRQKDRFEAALVKKFSIPSEKLPEIRNGFCNLLRCVDFIEEEWNAPFPDYPLLSCFFYLLFYSTDRPPLLDASEVADVLSKLESNEKTELMTFLWNHPSYMEYFSKNYIVSNKLFIRQGGRHTHTFKAILEPLFHFTESQATLGTDPAVAAAHRKMVIVKKKVMKVTGAFIKRLGRTYLFTDSASSFWNAYKICKPGEAIQDFAKECHVTRVYKEMDLFRSQFHEPVGVFLVNGFPVLDPDLEKMKIRGKHVVYHYRATPSYFEYLHSPDLDKRTFDSGRCHFIHDTIKQIERGMYPFLADLYHNESEQRGYLPLRDLFYEVEWIGGAGRLDRWVKSILYPNIRSNGIADVGDVHFASDLLPNRDHFRDIKRAGYIKNSKFASNPSVFLRANALSCMMMVDLLILACRYRQLGLADWRNDDHLEAFAKDLISGFTLILQTIREDDFETCHRFVLHSGVDWKRAARQLFFWTEPHGEAGYVSWVLQNAVPEGLYGPETKVNVNACDAGNFSPEKGFSSDGENNDIGPFNGPLCLTEIEKAWWVMTTFATG